MDDRWRFLDRWRAPETSLDPPRLNNLGGTDFRLFKMQQVVSVDPHVELEYFYTCSFVSIGLGSLPYSVP